jgi:hypothetical protein
MYGKGGALPQNRETGAARNKFGHENAPKVATAIGAYLVRPASNEADCNGKRAVIKSAARNTKSVGVTYSMLNTLNVVFAAFQHKTSAFEVYNIPASRFAELAVESRSSEHVGIVLKKAFIEEGQRIKVIKA